jgi:hypothetical protein
MSNKKNKQRQQYGGGEKRPSAPPTPVQVAVAVSPGADEAAVAELALEAEIALETAQLDATMLPVEEAAPARPLAELMRDATESRKRFEAARRVMEERQRQAEAERKEAAASRASAQKAEADTQLKLRELERRDQALQQRDDQIADRERDAEAGFLARRSVLLKPLEDERAALREQLTRLAAERIEGQTRQDAEFKERLAAQEREWREAQTARALEAERVWRELDARLAQTREEKLAEARSSAAEIIAAGQRSVEGTRAELEAREADLLRRERALRIERNELAAARELLDEDRLMLEQRIERRAGDALREALERAEGLEAERDRARRERDALQTKVRNFEDLERRLGSTGPEGLLQDLATLRAEAESLRRDLAERPSSEERLRLRALERQLAERDDNEKALRSEIATLTRRLGQREIAAVELETLRGQKEALETSRALLRTAHDELRAEVDVLTKKDDDKNPMASLLALDRLHGDVPKAGSTPTPPATLREFADDLRQRVTHAVEGRTLHYGPRDIRSFLGGLAMSPLVLLQGISGTGKTSLPIAFANAVGGDHTVVEVQAGWRDRQDLLGYYNAFHRHFYASNFLQALYRAGTPERRDRVTLLVLDEMNLSRVEQYFADFLSVMEQAGSGRRITLMADPVASPPSLLAEGRHLPIPGNVWFVGTANHDETTTAFADKTYDRAHVMELPRHPPSNGAGSGLPVPRSPISCNALRGMFDGAKKARAAEVKSARDWFDRGSELGPLLGKEFRLTWGNRLERDIEHYVPVVCEAGGSVGEAVDHLLQTKLLRKLRGRYDLRPQGLEDVRTLLEKNWIDAKCRPERSLELLDQEISARRNGAAE